MRSFRGDFYLVPYLLGNPEPLVEKIVKLPNTALIRANRYAYHYETLLNGGKTFTVLRTEKTWLYKPTYVVYAELEHHIKDKPWFPTQCREYRYKDGHGRWTDKREYEDFKESI
jgi:hypothetical protein